MPGSVIIVPWEIRFIPLLELSVKLAVVLRVPPLKVKWPGVAEPGGTPNPLSELMMIKPSFIVIKEYVLLPDKVSSPVPPFTISPVPLITPDIVWFDEDKYSKVPELLILAE